MVTGVSGGDGSIFLSGVTWRRGGAVSLVVSLKQDNIIWLAVLNTLLASNAGSSLSCHSGKHKTFRCQSIPNAFFKEPPLVKKSIENWNKMSWFYM